MSHCDSIRVISLASSLRIEPFIGSWVDVHQKGCNLLAAVFEIWCLIRFIFQDVYHSQLHNAKMLHFSHCDLWPAIFCNCPRQTSKQYLDLFQKWIKIIMINRTDIHFDCPDVLLCITLIILIFFNNAQGITVLSTGWWYPLPSYSTNMIQTKYLGHKKWNSSFKLLCSNYAAWHNILRIQQQWAKNRTFIITMADATHTTLKFISFFFLLCSYQKTRTLIKHHNKIILPHSTTSVLLFWQN